ncbi:unnamed protein product [Arabis nemorensis]|uniref:BRO1 domain-containing protein n=1 Tax=Arabis nemorensis TaxID=586526 RepID=A0A565BRS3_9BRAS|nr:unnamed protein product [Arabis nemorensis]
MTMLCYPIPIPKTKKIAFEKVIQFKETDTNLELNNLSLKRKQVEDIMNRSFLGTEAIVREDLLRIEEYLTSLQNLIDNLNKPCNEATKNSFYKSLKILWSSPLTYCCKPSNGLSFTRILQRKCKCKSSSFYQVNGILFELYMVQFLYALKLREKAMELIPTDMVQSTTAYREAAGVFDYLSQIVHPIYTHSGLIKTLPELTSSVCSSMSLLCLAEGQAVTVKKAKETGTSASLMTKLHYGVTQFVTEANIQDKELSFRFSDYVSTLGALHELKSGKNLAESLESEGKVGEAIGVLRRALATTKKTTQSRDSTWKSIFSKEKDQVTTMMNKYERLNKSMMLQRIPLEAELPLLQGEKIVRLITYHPTKKEKELNFELKPKK